MESVKFNSNWRNLNNRAKAPKDVKEQGRINKEVLTYIRILQEQIDELRAQLEDDGR